MYQVCTTHNKMYNMQWGCPACWVEGKSLVHETVEEVVKNMMGSVIAPEWATGQPVLSFSVNSAGWFLNINVLWSTGLKTGSGRDLEYLFEGFALFQVDTPVPDIRFWNVPSKIETKSGSYGIDPSEFFLSETEERTTYRFECGNTLDPIYKIPVLQNRLDGFAKSQGYDPVT